MKKLSFIVVLMMVSGLLFTSCEKEHECNPLPSAGNTNHHDMNKDGEIIVDTDTDDDEDEDDDLGITDGGRDEDYDKTGKKKKP